MPLCRAMHKVDSSNHSSHTLLQGDGSSITVEPGLIGGEINALLARHKAKGGHEIQYKIGPDPSSIDSCMIGGMVANNSSGMCCGVSQNVRPRASAGFQASTVPLAEDYVWKSGCGIGPSLSTPQHTLLSRCEGFQCYSTLLCLLLSAA